MKLPLQPAVTSKSARLAMRDAKQITRLYIAFTVFFYVDVFRLQDIVTPLQAVFPGVVAFLWLLFCLLPVLRQEHFQDTSTKLVLAFLAVMALGVINTVNHFWLFKSFQVVVTYFFAFFLTLRIVAQQLEHRDFILRSIQIFGLVIGLWVIFHDGRGPGGYLGDENDAGAALVMPMCVCGLRMMEERGWRRVIDAAVFLIAAAGIVMTESRGAFVAGISGLVLIAFFSAKLVRLVGVFSVVAILAVPFLPDGYLNDVKSISDAKDATRVERIESWKIGFAMFADNPLLGVGSGNYAWRVTEFEPSDLRERIGRPTLAGRTAHSMYFQLIPENGSLGTLAYLSLVLLAIRRCWRIIKSQDAAHTAWVSWAKVTLASLIAWMISSLFISTLYYAPGWLLLGMAAALPVVESLGGADISKRRAARS